MPTTKHSAGEVQRRVPIFSELTETELKFISERAVPRRYEAGEMLFREGELCSGLFVIESGNVRIFKTAAGGREQVLTVDGDEEPGSGLRRGERRNQRRSDEAGDHHHSRA